jgi:hypothetical protein
MSLAGASCGAPAAARPARRLAARAPRRVAARPPPAAASPRCSAAGRSLRAAAIGPEGSSPAFPAAYTVRLPRTPRHAAWRRGGNAGVIACPHVHSRAFRENTRRRNPAERTHMCARACSCVPQATVQGSQFQRTPKQWLGVVGSGRQSKVDAIKKAREPRDCAHARARQRCVFRTRSHARALLPRRCAARGARAAAALRGSARAAPAAVAAWLALQRCARCARARLSLPPRGVSRDAQRRCCTGARAAAPPAPLPPHPPPPCPHPPVRARPPRRTHAPLPPLRPKPSPRQNPQLTYAPGVLSLPPPSPPL